MRGPGRLVCLKLKGCLLTHTRESGGAMDLVAIYFLGVAFLAAGFLAAGDFLAFGAAAFFTTLVAVVFFTCTRGGAHVSGDVGSRLSRDLQPCRWGCVCACRRYMCVCVCAGTGGGAWFGVVSCTAGDSEVSRRLSRKHRLHSQDMQREAQWRTAHLGCCSLLGLGGSSSLLGLGSSLQASNEGSSMSGWMGGGTTQQTNRQRQDALAMLPTGWGGDKGAQ